MTRSSETTAHDSTGHPVVVLEGPSGSGKTSVLRALAGLFRHRLPCTSVRDLEDAEGATAEGQIPKLLTAIAYDLQRRWPRYGTIRFPRLIIGIKAMSLELDAVDWAKARSELDTALREWRGLNTAKKTLHDAAGDVLAALPAGKVVAPPSLVGRLLDGGFDLLVAWGPLRRTFLGAGEAWYGHQDRGLHGSSVDALVELNQWAAEPGDPIAQQSVNDLLLRAFLADLRADFAGRRQVGRQRFGCAVLLDTADCGLGQAFLGRLVQTRSALFNDGETGPDPLIVIATSEGALLSGRKHVRTVTDARQDRWGADGSDRGVWWLRLPLAPLTLDQVEAMVRERQLRGGNVHRLAAEVHRRFDGHPARTRDLLERIPEGESANLDLDALPATRPHAADAAFPSVVRNTCDFDPPKVVRRRRRIAFATALVVAVAALAFGAVKIGPHTCRLPGLDFGLSKVHGECVGVTDTRAYAFAPELRDIADRIAAENRRVAALHAPYVKVALMMPMTSGPTAAMTDIKTVLHSLEGSYVGQRRANGEYHKVYATPYVQLLLANEGRDEGQWRPVTEQLEGMTHGAHPLVAVVGMGISINETRLAIEELSAHHIGVFGAVLSATDIVRPGVVVDELTPSNDQYGQALADYVRRRPALLKGKAFMVYDKRPDNYVRTLAAAFLKRFPKRGLHTKQSPFVGSTGAYQGTAADFYDAVVKICNNESSLVFYAGRDRDLTGLVEALDARAPACKSMKPITVLTGATGVSLQSDPGLQQRMKAARMTLVDASSTDVRGWLAAPSPDFQKFLNAWRDKDLGAHDDNDALNDGYAIMHHDAVTAAVVAIKVAPAPKTFDVFNALAKLNPPYSVPGASGTVSFYGDDGGWPRGKRVPVIVTP